MSTSITKQIGDGLKRYYQHKGVSYLNDDGIGKFEEWIDENGYDTDNIIDEFKQKPSDVAFIDFDDNFPINSNDEDIKDKQTEILYVIYSCFKDPTAFINSCDLSNQYKNELNIIKNENNEESKDEELKTKAINDGILALQSMIKELNVNIMDENELSIIENKEELLGKGYQAESVKLRRWESKKLNVAIKKMNIINDYHMTDKGYDGGVKYQLKVIFNELRVFQEMNKTKLHQNIMQCMAGFISHDGICYNFICQVLEEKLFDFVKNDYINWKNNNFNNIPPISYRKAFGDLADGIQYFHDLGFVHRDMHKWNILIRRKNINEFDFVLIDFGLTLKYNENQLFQTGSERHYSPESCLNHNVYTSKSDVFSFGTILFEIINECKIIFGEEMDNNKALQLLSKGNMPKIENKCNPKYKETIEKCWIFDPKQRITAKQASHILLSSVQ